MALRVFSLWLTGGAESGLSLRDVASLCATARPFRQLLGQGTLRCTATAEELVHMRDAAPMWRRVHATVGDMTYESVPNVAFGARGLASLHVARARVEWAALRDAPLSWCTFGELTLDVTMTPQPDAAERAALGALRADCIVVYVDAGGLGDTVRGDTAVLITRMAQRVQRIRFNHVRWHFIPSPPGNEFYSTLEDVLADGRVHVGALSVAHAVLDSPECVALIARAGRALMASRASVGQVVRYAAVHGSLSPSVEDREAYDVLVRTA